MQNLFVILLVLLSSTTSKASGYSGSYLLNGTAKHKGIILINKEIKVSIGKKDITIYTDSLGYFEIRIQWSTFHTVGSTQKSITKQIPENIIFKHSNKTIKIKNEWRLSYEVFINPETNQKHELIDYPKGKEPMMFGNYPPYLYPNIYITRDLLF